MSNTISIPGYNSNNRVPGVFCVVDPSKANTATVNQVTLLIGQMLSSGSATAGIPVVSAGVGDAITSFGAGSQLAVAVERYRKIDLTGTVYCLPLADAASSAAATGSMALTGTATAASVLPLYFNDALIPVAVNLGDTATVIAGNAATAVAAHTSTGGNPTRVTASAATGTLTLTARNKGTIGNQYSIGLSLLGTAGGQGQPGTTNVPGVTATITQFSGGTIDPTIANALANLPARPFDFIYCPYNDTTSLNAVQSFLGDAAGRWNWSVELFGGAFTAKGGSLATRTTWSTARNDQHCDAIGAYGSPSPDCDWALDFCAVHAVSIRANPSVPIGGLAGGAALNVMAPSLANQDDFAEQETLLFDGMSTYIVNPAGQVSVQRAITTYQMNAAGQPDNSYLSSNVPYQLMAFMRAFITLMSSQFNQVILVADGSRIPAGSNMVTSQTLLYSVIAMYQAMATTGIPGIPAGLVQNPQAFQQSAQAENAGGGIVKMLLPVQLSNQLVAIAADVQFTTP